MSLLAASAALLLLHASEGQLKPVTVCEVVFNLKQFSGRTVLVLGRRTPTLEGEWLVEEDCGRKLVIDKRVWPAALALERSTVPPLPSPLKLNWDLVIDELRVVRTRTRIHAFERCRERYQQKWAVAIGRIEIRKKLGRIGFGHAGAAPAQLLLSSMVDLPEQFQQNAPGK